jgi:hypothetical protein
MKSVEDRIWDYIDGLCSIEEQEVISQLIVKDPVYRDLYNELMDLHAGLNQPNLDEPSMNFTNKVMDKIALQSEPLSAKSRIDTRIIYGISGLFGLMLLGCLVILLKNIDWSVAINPSVDLAANVKKIESALLMSAATQTILMHSFLMFDIIASLIILDKYLRNKLARNDVSPPFQF